MHLRHLAALTLIGWFLMMPPTGRDFPMGNDHAPLSQWVKRPVTYRDKAECEHVLDQQRRMRNRSSKRTAAKYFEKAQCISADDPRLKGK